MALPSRNPDALSEDNISAWKVGVEVDLATALEQEISILEQQSDPLSLAAANAVKQYLPEAA